MLRLKPADAARYVDIRLRMLREAPAAFGASIDETETVKPEYVADTLFANEAIATFAIADETDRLIAVASIQPVGGRKHAHRRTVWGVYVDPAHRGKGLARTLMAVLIEHARTQPGVDYVDLSVSADAPCAQRLYESMGFKAWGREPEATDIDGVRHDEFHMSLRL